MPRLLVLVPVVSALVLGCGGDDAGGGVAGSPDASAPHDAAVASRDPGSAVDAASPLDAPVSATDAPGLPTPDGATDAGCGYENEGKPLHVAAGIDLCVPHVACNSETCPPTLGACVDDACVFQGGYEGLQTFPEAWATYYCQLSTGGCHGVTQLQYPEVTAGNISQAMNLPLCEGAPDGTTTCIGIAASSPMVVGNSQLAVDSQTNQPVKDWGLGLTEASGLCYEITGPGGSAIVALTDRCGGYCKCNGSGFQECGPCVNAPDMEPNCACVGTEPGLYSACCGRGCATTDQACDWCASNNHPHFDLDTGTFNHVCGAQSDEGSCQMTSVRYVACMTPSAAWPP